MGELIRECVHGLKGGHHIAHYGCDGSGCDQRCPGGERREQSVDDVDVTTRIRGALAVWADPKVLPGAGSREAAGDVLADAARRFVEGELPPGFAQSTAGD